MTRIDGKMNIISVAHSILLQKCTDFDLKQTLSCGQAFRWLELEDGSFQGVVGENCCHISQKGQEILFYDTSYNEFERVWYDYFDFGRNYANIKKQLSSDPVFSKAITYAPGLRVLRQDSWEALCSFIISQNNHLKRIQGIVQRLCETLGTPIAGGFFTFPSAEVLAKASLEDLAPLRAGFRAKYLLDAAQKVASGEVRISQMNKLPIEQAREELMKIKGVGIKVAECALLYGCGRVESFPEDVWIKRAMEQLFPSGLPLCAQDCAGIAQQYLFHYVRTCPEALVRN